jgi:endonuclease-3
MRPWQDLRRMRDAAHQTGPGSRVRPVWLRDPRFERFTELFDEGRYFEAHEALEALWLEMAGGDRPFLQGLIQLAVALEHGARGNPSGAAKVLASAERRLAPYGARFAGIGVGTLRRRVAAFLRGERTTRPTMKPRSKTGAKRRKTTGAGSRDAKQRKTTGAGSRGAKKRKGTEAGSRGTKAKSAILTGKGAGASERSAAKRRTKRAGLRSAGRSPGPAAKKAPVPSTARPFRLEPLQARRERARAIVEGLRRLYPDASCEMNHGSALELIVATILSAQCTDVRVNMTTPALFARYRDAAAYAGADVEEIGAIVKSTGFFRNKARSIVALGRALVEEHAGEVPDTMEELVRLPGVGRKTANVVLSEWFGKPGIAVDTHVIRLSGPVWRLTDETDPVKIEFALYELLAEEDRSFFGIATIWHGRRVCAARAPDCGRCLLSQACPTAFTWARPARASGRGGAPPDVEAPETTG